MLQVVSSDLGCAPGARTDLRGEGATCGEKETGTIFPVLVEPRRGVPSLALQLQMGVFEEGPSRTPGMHWVSTLVS